jgi:hypothetical protein
MPSMTRHPGGGALAERIAALEAERLAPVPRASHAVGVDAGDLTLVLDYIRASASTGGTRVAAACARLEAAVRPHATPGPGWPGGGRGLTAGRAGQWP